MVILEKGNKKQTPTYITSGVRKGHGIDVAYFYDCAGNTYEHEEFKEISKEEFYMRKLRKELTFGISIHIVKEWINEQE